MERRSLAGGITVRFHPCSNGIRTGMKPNYFAAVTHDGDILGDCHHSTACRDNLFCSLTEPLEQLAFLFSEIFPAPAVDNLINWNPSLFNQLLVHINKGPGHSLGEQSSDAAFARTAITYKIKVHWPTASIYSVIFQGN